MGLKRTYIEVKLEWYGFSFVIHFYDVSRVVSNKFAINFYKVREEILASVLIIEEILIQSGNR